MAHALRLRLLLQIPQPLLQLFCLCLASGSGLAARAGGLSMAGGACTKAIARSAAQPLRAHLARRGELRVKIGAAAVGSRQLGGEALRKGALLQRVLHRALCLRVSRGSCVRHQRWQSRSAHRKRPPSCALPRRARATHRLERRNLRRELCAVLVQLRVVA